MRKTTLIKQQKVEELKSRILAAQTVVSFDDIGLTVKDSTDLRVQLHEEDCEMQVYKNNIARRALMAAGFDEVAETMVGKKVLVFGKSDVVAPARIVYEFSKKNKKIKPQAGIIEGKSATVEQILELATLPSYETLLTQIAAGLLSPVKELAIGLNMLAEEKEQLEA